MLKNFVLVALIAAVGLAESAEAKIIRHTFSGVMEITDGPWAPYLGEPFTGTLTYDSTTPLWVPLSCPPLNCPDPEIRGVYRHDPPYNPFVGIAFNIGDPVVLTVRTDPNDVFQVEVTNTAPPFGDRFTASGNGAPRIVLTDLDGTAFSNAYLPEILTFDDFEVAAACVLLEGICVSVGDLNSLVKLESPVPVPAISTSGLITLGTGIAVLGLIRILRFKKYHEGTG